jgi:hypothetical protein
MQRQNNKHGFGSGQFWPSPQMAGLDPTWPHLKKKPKKIKKKPFKKNYDFLKYFSTHFA